MELHYLSLPKLISYFCAPPKIESILQAMKHES